MIQIPSDLDNIGSVCMTKAFSYLTLNYTECQLKNIEDSQMPSYYSPRYGLQMVTCLEGKRKRLNANRIYMFVTMHCYCYLLSVGKIEKGYKNNLYSPLNVNIIVHVLSCT